jgi:multidrug efflux system membrane fusion protein
MTASQSQVNLVASNLKRYQMLYANGAVSQSDLENLQNSYSIAKASLNQVTAQYNQTMNQLNYTNLYADRSGVITSISAEAGQVVGAGQSVLTIVQNGQREVEISVPENRIDQLRQAEKVQVKFWALPNVVLEGKVREIVPVADDVTRTYKVHISLETEPKELELGMTSTVIISAQTGQQKGIYIPLSSIYQTESSPQVWVVKNGALHLCTVTVGSFNDNQIQVLSGLKNGDVIVTAGVHKLTEGLKVQPTSDNE